jgi:hypothetical protein
LLKGYTKVVNGQKQFSHLFTDSNILCQAVERSDVVANDAGSESDWGPEGDWLELTHDQIEHSEADLQSLRWLRYMDLWAQPK